MLPIYNNVPTGSGPTVKYEKKTTNFDAFSNKAYQLDMVDGVSKEVKILSGSDNDWLILDMSKWKRGLDGLTVTLNFNPQPLTNGETSFSKYIVDRPCVIHYRNLDGKWFIESAVGMDGNYLSLERAILDLTNKKFDWKSVSTTISANSVSFLKSDQFGNDDELHWCLVNESVIMVAGIIRSKKSVVGGRYPCLKLPDGYIGLSNKNSIYLPCTAHQITGTCYFELIPAKNEIVVDTVNAAVSLGASFIVNWVIPVRKV